MHPKRKEALLKSLKIILVVLLLFFIMYAGQPDIILSIPGLGTKSAQALLEIGLIYLILTYKPKVEYK